MLTSHTKLAGTTNGFVFVKTFKTGSSTSAGINLRIARNVARRLRKKFSICKARFDHTQAHRSYNKLVASESFLWSVVRDPTRRFVSQFFHFMVTRWNQEPTLANLRKYARTGHTSHKKMIGDHYLNFLPSRSRYDPKQDDPVLVLNEVLETYDFIAVTERMDESAVALSMLLRIPLADVLYLRAKESGGYDDAGGGDLSRTCKVIAKSSDLMTEEMTSFLDGDEWQRRSRWDQMLYQAANASLDLTIERLGENIFLDKLRRFRQAQTIVERRCLNWTVFPCSAGIYHPSNATDCIWNDSACGMDCIDEIATELGL